MTAQVIPLHPRQEKRRHVPMACKLLMIALPTAFAVGWLTMQIVSAPPRAIVQAQERRLDFSIGAGNLRQALEKYARQAGVRLEFDPVQLAGLTTQGLEGHLTPREALDTLLRGTGWTGSLENGRYVLAPETPSASSRPASRRAYGPQRLLAT